MELPGINEKTSHVKLLNATPLGFKNTSQYKLKPHNDDYNSNPELMILDSQILRHLKIPFNKNCEREKTAELKKHDDRELIRILIKRESQIKHEPETKESNCKVANVLKCLICKCGEKKLNSKNKKQIKKLNCQKSCQYTVNRKSVKVNDIMMDVIDCKLQVLCEMNQIEFLNGLVKEGYLNN